MHTEIEGNERKLWNWSLFDLSGFSEFLLEIKSFVVLTFQWIEDSCELEIFDDKLLENRKTFWNANIKYIKLYHLKPTIA